MDDDSRSLGGVLARSGSARRSSRGSLDDEGDGVVAAHGNSRVALGRHIRVERSKQVQIGNSTHYHAPVMLVVADKDGPKASVVLSAASLAANFKENRVYSQQSKLHGDTPFGAPAALGCTSLLRRRRVCVSLALLAAAVMVAVVFATARTALARGPDAGHAETKETDHSDSRAEPDQLPNGVKLVTRASWGARSPAKGLRPLRTPVNIVVVHHTATAACFYTTDCIGQVSLMQNNQMFGDRRLDDISYNFLVGGDGVVYEGRGWGAQGQHTCWASSAGIPPSCVNTQNWDQVSIGVALIGTFTALPPATQQRDMLVSFLRWGVDLGKIHARHNLAGVCQFKSTMSPGLRFMEELRTWPSWWNHTEESGACSE